MSESILPVFFFFFPKNFTVSGLTFRSLFHLEFIFVYNIKKCTNFILLHAVVQFFQHCLLKGLFLYIVSSKNIQTNAEEAVEKRESSYTVGGNINWYDCKEQQGSFLQN